MQQERGCSAMPSARTTAPVVTTLDTNGTRRTRTRSACGCSSTSDRTKPPPRPVSAPYRPPSARSASRSTIPSPGNWRRASQYPEWLTGDSPAGAPRFPSEMRQAVSQGRAVNAMSQCRVGQVPRFVLGESGKRGPNVGFCLRYSELGLEPRKVQARRAPFPAPSAEPGPAFPAERVLGIQGRAAPRALVFDLRAATAAEAVVDSERLSALRATALCRLRLRRALCAEDDWRALPPYGLPGRGDLPAVPAVTLADLRGLDEPHLGAS